MLAVEGCEECRHPTPACSPVCPVAPGLPLQIWSGTVHRFEGDGGITKPVPGRLTLRWRRTFSLELDLDDPTYGWWPEMAHQSPTPVGIDFAGASSSLSVFRRRDDQGWCNGGVLGDEAAPAVKLTALLSNFPSILSSGAWLHDHELGRTWNGRWEVAAAGWLITLDQSFEHTEDFRRAREDQSYALTHVVGISRADGAAFNFAAADNIVFGLQVALSFAAGYWVGVICPTGHDEQGKPTWMQVGPPHTGRAESNNGWWNNFHSEDLAAYLKVFLPLWNNPQPTDPLRSATTGSILSHASGFVEQRIITALSSLETLSWTHEVIEGTWPARQWEKSAPRRIRRLLKHLHIDPRFVDGDGRDAISAYGRGCAYHDLAETVAEVRNRITHPKPEHNIYDHDGVVLQTWLLVSYWLELAILRRIDFRGEAVDRTNRSRWAGQSEPVPWADASTDTDDDRA